MRVALFVADDGYCHLLIIKGERVCQSLPTPIPASKIVEAWAVLRRVEQLADQVAGKGWRVAA